MEAGGSRCASGGPPTYACASTRERQVLLLLIPRKSGKARLVDKTSMDAQFDCC